MGSNFASYKNKCLFLWLSNKDFHAVEAAKRGVDVAQVYVQLPYILRAIRRVQIELNIPWISPWLSSWKKKLTDYETVIVHASKITPPVIRFIRYKSPKVRIVVWYWNPVEKCVDLDQFSSNDCEIWSFDETDCEKYGLKHNTQYYFNDISLQKSKIEYDVFFVGGDKGRIKNLIEIQEDFKDLNISSYFHITNTGNTLKQYRHVYKERISYQDILVYISKSRAILDYVSEKQSGLTLRPLEALFFRKKLITNDTTIMNKDFYSKENIFILGKDDLNDLYEFLHSPYESIPPNIVNRYDFDNWLGRFFKETGEV